MPIIAESADGKQHEFPDGTEPAVVDRAMKQYAEGQTSPTTSATEPKKELPWYQKVSHGFAAPIVGLDMLASQIEQYFPFAKETAAQDLEAAKKQQKTFSEDDTPGFSAWEMAGGLLNPAYYMGGPVRGAGLAANVGKSALAGAKIGAIQPRESENYWTNTTLGAAGGAAVGGAAGAAVHPIANAIAGNLPSNVDKFVIDKFRRGVGSGPKGTFTAAEQYDNAIVSGVGSIIDNKANLLLTDADGITMPGVLPKTPAQFSEAVHQTQSELFRRYNYMTKAAEGNISVDLHTVADKIENDVINNKATRDFSPNVINYAKHTVEALRARDMYSPLETQDAIQHLNAKLQAFYKNESYETVNHARVDAMAAHELREKLDKAVEAMVGPGYQALKNQYGALRAVEKDVVDRALREASRRGGGLSGNIGDIAAAHSVISGVLHGNLATAAAGGGLSAYTHIMRWMRSPNRAVSRLFDVAEQARGLPPGPARQKAADLLMNVPTMSAVAATQPGPGETGR